MWNGFDLIPDKQLQVLLKSLDESLLELDNLQSTHKQQTKQDVPYSSFYDDFCLARFFKGLAIRELTMPSCDYLVPAKQILEIKPTKPQIERLEYAQKQLDYIVLQADDIELDHWILPYARYELGHLHLRLGNYDRAKMEYHAAQSGGYSESDSGQQKKNASMESSLHLKVHNALLELSLLKSMHSPNSQPDLGSPTDQEQDDDSD